MRGGSLRRDRSAYKERVSILFSYSGYVGTYSYRKLSKIPVLAARASRRGLIVPVIVISVGVSIKDTVSIGAEINIRIG